MRTWLPSGLAALPERLARWPIVPTFPPIRPRATTACAPPPSAIDPRDGTSGPLCTAEIAADAGDFRVFGTVDDASVGPARP